LPNLANEYQQHFMVTKFQVYHHFIVPMEAPAVDYHALAASVAEKLMLHCPDFRQIAINDTYVGFKPSFPGFKVSGYFGWTSAQTFD